MIHRDAERETHDQRCFHITRILTVYRVTEKTKAQGVTVVRTEMAQNHRFWRGHFFFALE